MFITIANTQHHYICKQTTKACIDVIYAVPAIYDVWYPYKTYTTSSTAITVSILVV